MVPTELEDKRNKHVPNSASCYFVCTFDNSRHKLFEFVGNNCVEDLVSKLKEISKTCILEMKNNVEIKMEVEDETNHRNAKTCSICNEEFDKSLKAKHKVRDHCHRTGNYRGAAHSKCNINYFNNRYLPVVFHNLRGYDSHLIIKKAFDVCERSDDINAIANSTEKIVTFSIGDIQFIDSLQFMPSSLETLAKNLLSNKDDKYENYHNMKKTF